MAERVLHFLGGLDAGGAQSVVRNLFYGIQQEGFCFDFVLDHPGELGMAGDMRRMGAKIYAAPPFYGTNALQVLRFWEDFFRKHREYRILHSHIRGYASLVFFAARRHGLKCVIHSHNTSNGRGIPALAKAVLQYPLRFQADFFLACSIRSGHWLFGRRIVRGKAYHTLKNGILLREYAFRAETRRRYRAELGLSGKKVFCHVGRFRKMKNHAFLLELFQELYRRDPDARLLLIGDGELREEMERMAAEKQLRGAVLFLGQRQDVPGLLMASDCMLFPSLWEGVPLALVEAQAAGLPCLISDRIDPEAALSGLVRQIPLSAHVQGWADEVQRMDWERQDVRRSIRKAGYDMEREARILARIYRRLIGGEEA